MPVIRRPASPLGTVLSLLCIAWPVPCHTQESPAAPDSARVFHRGLPYGSDALFNPVTIFLNRGFDIVQLTKSDRDIWSFPYRVGFTQFLPDVILHPRAAIERHPGWSEWLRTEVLPLSVGDARWVVNWTEYFLAGGLSDRGLADWYGEPGVPRPKVLAGVTWMAASALNEVMEHPDIRKGTSSSVADLWLFDLGGVLFFTWDRPARWAVEHLRLADWSNMPSFMVPGGELENNGQYLVVKLPLPRVDERLFVRFGLGIQFGVTRASGRTSRSCTAAACTWTEATLFLRA